jgi:hypothetical protein
MDHLIKCELKFESETVIWSIKKKTLLVIEWATTVMKAFIGPGACKFLPSSGTSSGMWWSEVL